MIRPGILISFALGAAVGAWGSAWFVRGPCAPTSPVAARPSPDAPARVVVASSPARVPPTPRERPSAAPAPVSRDASSPEPAEIPQDETCPHSAAEYFSAHPRETQLTCRCSASATESGSVWGTGLYTADSSICRAAKHAGYWRYDGDEVTIYPRDGQSRYEGTRAYDVESQGYGSYPASFSFD